MKVFMCKRQSGYSGGLAVVAANSVKEAYLNIMTAILDGKQFVEIDL